MSDFLSGVKLVVSDFDGVFTDMRAIHEPYLQHNRRHLERLLADRLEPDQVAAALDAALDEIAQNPYLYGWRKGDYIVAPAGSDPYIWIRSAVTVMLNELAVFESVADRDAFQESVFKDFEKVSVPLKPKVRGYLKWLGSDAFTSVIVSNSSTKPVRGRLLVELSAVLQDADREAEACAAMMSEPAAVLHTFPKYAPVVRSIRRFLDTRLVFGGAKKYYVAQPEPCQRFDGLDRPVLLDRPYYLRLLRGLLAGLSLGFEDMLVIGDIFELDLAVPLVSGARVVLVDNGTNVMPWERKLLDLHPNARIVRSLAEIPNL